jgi:hypothetical protein
MRAEIRPAMTTTTIRIGRDASPMGVHVHGAAAARAAFSVTLTSRHFASAHVVRYRLGRCPTNPNAVTTSFCRRSRTALHMPGISCGATICPAS